MDNTDDTALFFLFINAGTSPVHDYIKYSTALLTYFPQKFRKSILIISRNRDTIFRLIERVDRVFKIELLKKDDSRNLL
jgi:hypothetical protein